MRTLFCSFFITLALLLSGCGKRNCGCVPPPAEKYRLTYGDSVFYLKSSDYTMSPLLKGSGTYTAFPNNLQIDRRTGVVTVTQKGIDGESQTGMWYKIKFQADATSDADSTLILLSGISYVDKFYNLAQNDSIIYPIYNGDPANTPPAGNYDLTSDNKFAVNAANGQINIKECLRRGFFNSSSQMGTGWKVATVKYALNDKSQQATNKIDVVIYYYSTLADVPGNVSILMQAHQQMTVGMRSLPTIPSTTGPFDNNLPSELSLAKPRPPCLVIIGH